jgi:hypothetical protein
MACISRCFGGLRTGDMHALRWESLDTEDGQFRFGWAPRKRTARRQLLAIPAMLRPLIRDWWERTGRPSTGLLFAARRGEHAGSGPKIGVSHAVAFRRDLRRAFGVDAWDAETRRFHSGRIGSFRHGSASCSRTRRSRVPWTSTAGDGLTPRRWPTRAPRRSRRRRWPVRPAWTHISVTSTIRRRWRRSRRRLCRASEFCPNSWPKPLAVRAREQKRKARFYRGFSGCCAGALRGLYTAISLGFERRLVA